MEPARRSWRSSTKRWCERTGRRRRIRIRLGAAITVERSDGPNRAAPDRRRLEGHSDLWERHEVAAGALRPVRAEPGPRHESRRADHPIPPTRGSGVPSARQWRPWTPRRSSTCSLRSRPSWIRVSPRGVLAPGCSGSSPGWHCCSPRSGWPRRSGGPSRSAHGKSASGWRSVRRPCR